MFKGMQLEEAIRGIKSCTERMNALYGGVVFDEWAVVALNEGKPRLLNYSGPRPEGFRKNFAADAAELRKDAQGEAYAVGDFEFARHAEGTAFESFMVVGQGLFLICNNTTSTIDKIAKEPTWRGAQVPFVDLSEKFRASPLTV